MPGNDRTIYVVDADGSVRRSLKRLLAAYGMTARSFASVNEFIESAPVTADACLVIDADSAQATPELVKRLQDFDGDFHVVVLSAGDEEAGRRVAAALGAIICLRKPVDGQALVDAILWGYSPK